MPFDYCVDEERFVWLRPGLRRFLAQVRPLFEVVLFTAAGESWATCALQRIDPTASIFDSRCATVRREGTGEVLGQGHCGSVALVSLFVAGAAWRGDAAVSMGMARALGSDPPLWPP